LRGRRGGPNIGAYPLYEEDAMERARRFARFPVLALLAVAAASLAGCVAPNNAYLMELNRSGKWKEAERVGQDMLVHRRTFTFSQIGETYYHVAYAETRQGKKDEAVQTIRQYEDFSAGGTLDSEHLWLDGEVIMLKYELGLLNEIQATIVDAMEENRKGDYSRARELCGKALAMKGLTDLQLATAHFVAAVCSIRLKDAPSARTHMAAFRALKPSLRADNQMLREEAYVAKDLLDLEESGK
jgi:hypothetical protein